MGVVGEDTNPEEEVVGKILFSFPWLVSPTTHIT